jgi:hypothetical protein
MNHILLVGSVARTFDLVRWKEYHWYSTKRTNPEASTLGNVAMLNETKGITTLGLREAD